MPCFCNRCPLKDGPWAEGLLLLGKENGLTLVTSYHGIRN